MSEFKVGDLVKCINAGLHLTEGNVYKVLDVIDNCNTGAIDTVRVKNDCGADIEYFSTRFELYTIPKDPLVTIRQSEYDNLIEEINALQELVKELSAPQDTTCDNIFKPISDYTLEDWQQAIDEDWEFECRNGYPVQVVEVNRTLKYPVECTDGLCRDIKGFWCSDTVDADDIIKRIL